MRDGNAERAYWRALLRRTAALLAVWFVAGALLGVLLVEPLNAVRLGGMPLGFWVAQQGSIYVFVVLIFVYAVLSDRADRAAGIDPAEPPAAGGAH